jgi:hypothetical protein
VIESRRNGIQIVIEQVRVDIERDGRRGVTEHPLDGFDVRP